MYLTNNELSNPEAELFSKLSNCRYYLNDQLDTNLKHVNGLTLIHFNARSLQTNCDKIQQFLNLFDRSFDIIAISETWRTESTNLGDFLRNYEPSHTYRQNGRGGGVSIYVKKSIPFKVIHSLSKSVDNLYEVNTIEIDYEDKKSIVSCMYRKPGSCIDEFQSNIEDLVNSTKHKTLYICGDFNIDLIKYNSHEPSKQFTDSLFSLGLIPLITMPTRITNTSETLVDNIFTNNLSTEHYNGILLADVSDHLPIFTMLQNYSAPEKSGKTYVLKRKINDATVSKLNNKYLSEETWSNVFESNDVNVAYGEFINTFMKHFRKSCTVTGHYSPRRLDKPWFTSGLKNACRKKNVVL